ncbi:TenA-like transcription activator [Leptospira ellinghausenii]|uniref:TenA-like transcription activator n=1 Tax=Leptospira ellinghausenii TaxID=1917822 RepID=A0A2P2DD18_9LEPT|nr:TenA family protein [Leptospira ellinghausenii]GBF42510.1 TenA-like transcription activator [Leptospira ellinghausenii]
MQSPFLIPPFALECKTFAKTSFGASFNHPFVLSLADGSLDPKLFRFYQIQDAKYLEAFSDACAILSTKVKDPDDKLWFIDAARMALVVEGQLHLGYGKSLGYDAKTIANTEPTPNNLAYQNHMVATALQGTILEGLCAIAPCPWLYVELGQHILREKGSIPDDHPYASWLTMYSDPGFNEYMSNLLTRLQKYADLSDSESKNRAKVAFQQSCNYEWMFWEQAWTNQNWPSR